MRQRDKVIECAEGIIDYVIARIIMERVKEDFDGERRFGKRNHNAGDDSLHRRRPTRVHRNYERRLWKRAGRGQGEGLSKKVNRFQQLSRIFESCPGGVKP